MHILSVNHNELDFKTIEEEIYKTVCEVACGIMKDILEKIDLILLAKGDTKRYRNKVLYGTLSYPQILFKNQSISSTKAWSN